MENNIKRNILFVSMCLPFDKAFHAGGKTFNYYINKFAMEQDNSITLIAKVLPEEEKYINSLDKRIQLYTVSTPKNKLKRILAYLISINSKVNPFYKYGNVLTKEIYNQVDKRLRYLKRSGYTPDVIVLEWTSMLLYIDAVKNIFPYSKYVASEHDVTFLGQERRFNSETFFLKKILAKIKYNTIKKNELNAVNNCDFVVTHNHKDRKLLIQNGIDAKKVGCIIPYFDKFPSINRKPESGNIIYYGAMNRIENESAAIWFIDNVMPLLKEYNITFTIIGSKPSKKLLSKASDIVYITRFVDNPASYFEKAMCLVAPLLLGAGVKVKIIEALSSGVPVITNNIGIEGIDAEDKIDYFFAEKPNEYAKLIVDMIKGNVDISKISHNAISLIESQYNLQKSYEEYSSSIYKIIS